MSTSLPNSDGWQVGVRVWIERAGQAVLGEGRLELLEAIDREHSISAAARGMGMSYRRAWEMVQAMNEAAGQPLVTATTGGPQGGGARITPLGRWAVETFRAVRDRLHGTAGTLLPVAERFDAPSLHVAAAVSLEEVVGQLLNDFAAREPGVRVRAVYGASDELADHLLAGAPGDVYLTADPRQLERLRAARLLCPGEEVALAGNALAAIGPAGAKLAVPDAAALSRAGDVRVALAAPACPLGGYTRAWLESLDLYDRLRRHAVQVESSRAVVTAVRAGQADAGLVYASDAVRAEGCRVLFHVRHNPFPIRYLGAVLGRAGDAALARRLLDFLASDGAAGRFLRCGFLPAHGG